MADPKIPINAGRKTGATQGISSIKHTILARILEEITKRRVRGLINCKLCASWR